MSTNSFLGPAASVGSRHIQQQPRSGADKIQVRIVLLCGADLGFYSVCRDEAWPEKSLRCGTHKNFKSASSNFFILKAHFEGGKFVTFQAPRSSTTSLSSFQVFLQSKLAIYENKPFCLPRPGYLALLMNKALDCVASGRVRKNLVVRAISCFSIGTQGGSPSEAASVFAVNQHAKHRRQMAPNISRGPNRNQMSGRKMWCSSYRFAFSMAVACGIRN